MKLFVGLGNPGLKYERTRHNAGFMVIDQLSKAWNIQLSEEKKFKGEIGRGVVKGEKVILLKPTTFMNLSGESVRAVMDFYDVDIEDLIVIYDDLDLPHGKIRMRLKGSAGGHNGIKSIIAHTGTQNFMRVKVGVGEKPSGWDLADYVLGHFSDEDNTKLKEIMPDIIQAVTLMVQGDVDKAMNDFNAKKQV